MAFLPLAAATLLTVTTWLLWRFVFRHKFSKSSLPDLPGPPRLSLLSGNLQQIWSPNGIPWHSYSSRRYGRAFKYHGLIGDQHLYITDPLALHYIVLKDQDVYEQTSTFVEGNKLIFGDGLLSALGENHKRQRRMLNPVFSIAHMRNLAPIFNQITSQLQGALVKQISSKGAHIELDIHYWISRAALEIIGQAGLGYSFENLDDEKATTEYARAVKDLFPAIFGISMARQFAAYARYLGPTCFRAFIMRHIPFKNFQRIKKVADVMHNASLEILRQKEQILNEGDEAAMAQVGEGKDIMSVLLKSNSAAGHLDRLPENEILAQMSTLAFGANDTTSNSIARILDILSSNPDSQQKLREEVTAARAGGTLSYDTLVDLPYLDAVVRETMRLYAPLTFATRTTRRDIILPLGTPIKSADGKKDIREIMLKNNTNVTIGIAAVNRDPEIWGDDAEDWVPERWINRNVEEVAKERLPGVYSGTMTFLGGARACIGFKFSVLEMKTIVAMLVETFIFEPSDKEIIWRISVVATPATRGKETETPHLPLKISLVQHE